MKNRAIAKASRSRSEGQSRPKVAAPPITMNELGSALRKLKRGKAKDASGTIVEMLKDGGDRLSCTMLELFNDLLQPDAPPPASWRRTRLTVIFKKHDPELLQITSRSPSYRSCISFSPECFATAYRTMCLPSSCPIRPITVQASLLKIILLIEACNEFNQDLFIGLIDVEKNSDTIEHEELWQVLRKLGVEEPHCRDQTATIAAGVDSTPLCLMRGVKQGDPISGLLFICLMEICFRDLKSKWAQMNERRRRHIVESSLRRRRVISCIVSRRRPEDDCPLDKCC